MLIIIYFIIFSLWFFRVFKKKVSGGPGFLVTGFFFWSFLESLFTERGGEGWCVFGGGIFLKVGI